MPYIYIHMPIISTCLSKIWAVEIYRPLLPSSLATHVLPDGQRHMISQVGAHLSQDLGMILEDPRKIEK